MSFYGGGGAWQETDLSEKQFDRIWEMYTSITSAKIRDMRSSPEWPWDRSRILESIATTSFYESVELQMWFVTKCREKNKQLENQAKTATASAAARHRGAIKSAATRKANKLKKEANRE